MADETKIKYPNLILDSEEDTLIRRVADDYRYCNEEIYSKENDNVREDFDFYHGNQWTDTEITKMESLNKPSLTINMVKPLVDLVQGINAQNNYRMKFYATELNDEPLATVADHLYKWNREHTELNFKEDDVFLDMSIAGKGFVSIDIDYDKDPLHGELVYTVEDPLRIFPDPNANEYDLSDAEYIMKVSYIDKETLIHQFPDKEDDINALGERSAFETEQSIISHDIKPDNYADDRAKFRDSKPKLRVIEYWYKEHYTKNVIIDVRIGQEVPLQTELTDELKKRFEKMGMSILEVPAHRIKIAILADDRLLLQDEDSPLPVPSMYPFVPFFCYEDKKEKIHYGITRNLIDVQKERNKRRSQIAHILNTTANNTVFLEKGSVDDIEEVKTNMAKPGGIVEYNTGRTPPQQVSNPAIPTGLLTLDRESYADGQRISGVNANLLGVQGPETSGIAIQLKQRQGAAIVNILFQNYKRSKKILAKKTLLLLSKMLPENKSLRIIGEDSQIKFIALREFLQKFDIYKFDLICEEQKSLPTVKHEQFIQFSELKRHGANVPDSMLVEMSDLDADQKQKYMKMMQDAQQAAQKNAQQKAQLETQEKQVDMKVKLEELEIEKERLALEKLKVEYEISLKQGKYAFDLYKEQRDEESPVPRQEAKRR